MKVYSPCLNTSTRYCLSLAHTVDVSLSDNLAGRTHRMIHVWTLFMLCIRHIPPSTLPNTQQESPIGTGTRAGCMSLLCDPFWLHAQRLQLALRPKLKSMLLERASAPLVGMSLCVVALCTSASLTQGRHIQKRSLRDQQDVVNTLQANEELLLQKPMQDLSPCHCISG